MDKYSVHNVIPSSAVAVVGLGRILVVVSW